MKPHALLVLACSLLGISSACCQYNVIPQTGHNNVIVALEYSPDGRYLATAGHDFKVLLWETSTGIHYPLFGHSTVVSDVEFSPDNKYLVSTDQGGNTIVWDITTHAPITKIINNDESQAISRLQFINNNQIALLNERMFKIWNFRDNTYPEKVPLKGTYFTVNPAGADLLLLENSSTYANGSFIQTNKLILYDRVKQSPVDDQWIRASGEKWSKAEFSATGKYLVLSGEGKIVLFDYKAKKKLWAIPVNCMPAKLVITSDESRLIFSGDFEHPDLYVHDLKTGKELQHLAQFTDFQFAYNHQLQLIAGSRDAGDFVYPISIYDLKAHATVKTIQPNNYKVAKIAWNENARQLYAVAETKTFVWDLSLGAIVDSQVNDFDSEIMMWKKGTVKYGFKHYGPQRNLYAETNESYVGAKIFNAKGQEIFSTNIPVVRVIFSNDEKVAYCISPDDVVAFNISSGAVINQLHYDKSSPSVAALSPDGKYLAVGKFWFEGTNIREKYYAIDYRIDLLDPTTLKVLKQLEGHTANVTSLDFTQDNKFLISSSTDGSIRFWDVAMGKQKAILYGDSPNDYFMLLDNGFYSSSKSAIDKIAFEYNRALIPGKLFETQMNRPDKVADGMGYSSGKVIAALKKAFEKRMLQLGMTEQPIKIEELPKITVTNLPPPSVDSKKIEIGYEAFDNINDLNQIKLLINNVPVYGRKGFSVKNKKTVKGKLTIELTEGKNSVELSAVNSKGAASLPVAFDVFCTVKTVPDLYLITIGVDKFLDQSYNLGYAAKDAQDIAALFESKKSNYGKIITIPFNGIQATKENILAVRARLEQSQPDDQVIIFAATHGLLDENYDYYLATYNMVFDKPAFQGLAYNDLEGLMDGIPARKKLILLDACHSGEVDATEITASTEAVSSTPGVKARGFKPVKKVSSIGLENTFDLMKNMFADLREGTGTTVISSAGGVEFAIESEQWSNGAFTAALLEGVKTKKADGNGDGNISVGELKSFVFTRVIEITNGKQHPTSRIDNIDNDFTIISTIASGGKLTPITGNWTPSEIDYDHNGEFEKIDPNHRAVSITKGPDGFYYLSYGAGDIKLNPTGTNEHSAPSGFTVKGETENTIVIYDNYSGDIRYTKAQ
jgi:WD40 repeat protein